MSEPFIAEIKIFAGNFAPRGYAFCNGQLLPISQNTALFSLVGTTYGGDGRTTFGLPNLMGRVPMHPGSGSGLSTRRLGESGGLRMIQLNTAQMPNHTHIVRASSQENTEDNPAGNTWGVDNEEGIYRPVTDVTAMLDNPNIELSGGGQVHNNMQPYLVLNFIIALVGLFPSRA
jgi:microcystin-dependent protein